MRNQSTANLSDTVTRSFNEQGLDVDVFIDSIAGAFDKRYLEEAPGCNGGVDGYAHYHKVIEGNVCTFYYWLSEGRWFCKA